MALISIPLALVMEKSSTVSPSGVVPKASWVTLWDMGSSVGPQPMIPMTRMVIRVPMRSGGELRACMISILRGEVTQSLSCLPRHGTGGDQAC